MTRILESNFSNTYGGLDLVQADNGEKYLEMGDCFGPRFFGPLTASEERAFRLLCDVEEMQDYSEASTIGLID